MIKYLERNEKGRDFVVGDIHGCFTKLTEALKKIKFNEEVDRLITVGDLVDRGPESDECLDWLAKPWFYSVIGNHEQMALDCEEGMFDSTSYTANGGRWFMDLDGPTKSLYADVFRKLPAVIEIDTPTGIVGVLHAECIAEGWLEFKADLPKYWYGNTVTWGRSIICGMSDGVVKNVDRIYVGHTPVPEPVVVGNHHFIDMGTCFKGGKDFYLEQIT